MSETDEELKREMENGIIVSQTLIDRQRRHEWGWRSDTGCANEHHIPTLSPMGTQQGT